jgi:UDP-glucose:(heptosyl)LPS alpha-1,3-glucosyltransferase
VVTTATNGAGEVITPGREGFVVPEASDVDALADALDRLCDDPDRRAMAAAARRLGNAQSFDVHLDRLIALFEEVADDRAARLRMTPSRRDAQGWRAAG